MLQQTRAATAVDYYARWMQAFPTLADLAAADVADCLRLWRGLGYYGRVHNLHRAAGIVVRDRGGRMPSSRDEWRQLPGIGAYTAGAIASIAHGERVPAVDANALRVLARLLAVPGDPSRGASRRIIETEAVRLADGARPGDLNQALMDLGATVCVAGDPACAECPIQEPCATRRLGLQAQIPAGPHRPAARPARALALAIAEPGGRRLVAQRAEDGLFGGLWEYPMVDAELEDVAPGAGAEPGAPTSPHPRWAARVAERATGQSVLAILPAERVEHALTHRRFVVHPALVLVAGPAEASGLATLVPAGGRSGEPSHPYRQWCWAEPGEIASLPGSRLMDKVHRAVNHAWFEAQGAPGDPVGLSGAVGVRA
jgi:A/G-specific adenine glycosylase